MAALAAYLGVMRTGQVRPVRAFMLCAAVGLCATSAACSRNADSGAATGPTVDVPRFAVVVTLSRAAVDRLHGIGESVKVVAYFDGDALPGQGKYNPAMRDVYLGMAERAVDERSVARFEDVKIPQRDWNRLSNKDYFVTINTVSARRVAKDNLLECTDPISVNISVLQDKTTEIGCRLIGESTAPH